MIELIFGDRCTGCGTCEEVCPTNVFDLDDRRRPVIARQAECDSCYLCEAHCPADALYVGPLRRPQPVTHEQVLALGVLGNFRRAVGFDQYEPGSYCYSGALEASDGEAAEGGPVTERAGPNAGIYAALALARQRGLVDVSRRGPIEREIVL
jgi:NAD-dependent dihydropyrimidine dehydrogenase PreA subunit